MAVKGKVRRSQLVTTYGVGAIVAVEDESVMVAGIDRWEVSEPNLHEPRLEKQLGVTGFVIPPASEHGNDVPVVRFPKWVSCPSCQRLGPHSFFGSSSRNTCQMCEAPLVPSRFVIVCERGHIDDFPYHRWVHSGHKVDGPVHNLRIETTGGTASLASIRVVCECGCVRTLEGSFAKSALRGVVTCSGARPWLSDREECDLTPRTLQRGASNVWFPVVSSALSIPPWSEEVFRALNRHWPVIRSVPADALPSTLDGMRVMEKTNFSMADLLAAIAQRKAQETGSDPSDDSIRSQEYEAFMKGRAEDKSRPDFVCTPAEETGPVVAKWLGKVMLVRRLREVRVLESFARLMPPVADQKDTLSPLFASNPGWLPAIEVLGEGVFLQLSSQRIEEWEKRVNVRTRAATINGRYAARFAALGRDVPRKITPRLLLAHTTAHAVINQWSLDSGYSASSLRERLYVDDISAAFLIYTATTDSAGSLGGVVAQAESGRLDSALIEGVNRVAWCSADPLCSEADSAGVDGLNLAACHACVLLPEVSCEEMNSLLDRAMLVGTPADPTLGFFTDLIEG